MVLEHRESGILRSTGCAAVLGHQGRSHRTILNIQVYFWGGTTENAAKRRNTAVLHRCGLVMCIYTIYYIGGRTWGWVHWPWLHSAGAVHDEAQRRCMHKQQAALGSCVGRGPVVRRRALGWWLLFGCVWGVVFVCLCVGVCVGVHMCLAVCGSVSFAERLMGFVCVACVGIWVCACTMVCLLLSRCCPPRHLFPCM